MNYLSVCSGIEAATAAWHPLGWTPVGFSEIEKFPSAVLAHHYPDVPNLGDMSKFQEWPDDLAPNLLVGGTPCQSFSVAGLRKGLDDPRGNLMLTFGSIARRYRPEWLVWENVPGVLSSNGGRDFGTFLGMLAELGYGFAYRVLDAQFFGLAQRRRRVFVVGHLGDWRRAAAVLFERESLSGNPAPRREPGEGIAYRTARSLGNEWPHEVAGTLDAHYGDKMGLEDQHVFNQRASRFAPVPFDTTQITSAANYSSPKPGDPCHPLAAGAHAPAIAFAIQAGAMRQNPKSGPDGVGVQADHAYTLEARAEVQAVAFNWQGGGTQTSLGYDPESGVTGSLHVGQTPAVALALRGREGGATAEVGDDCAFTLRASDGGGDKPHVMTGMAVRRLTPRECERLQGFPDDFTRIPWKAGYWSPATNPPEVVEAIASECPDGPRYKALGNSMAVPVMSWLGRRIAEVSAIEAKREAA